MADNANIVVRAENQGYRNTVVRASLVSDGSGLSAYALVGATSAAIGAVNLSVTQAGQTFYPGTHLTIVGLDYDVQDMKLELLWKATANEQIMALGSAPEDFVWTKFGGIRVPSGLAGATGDILLTTLNQASNSTFMLILYLRNNVPQS